MKQAFDVAIVGGGPGGSSCAAFLRKYRPQLSVAIFERERFPRDHVGESQLPLIGQTLAEIGAWEKVEAAGFPIKIGATYRWGSSDDLWDFHFLPNGEYTETPRPGRYEGQRIDTAFQVDRAVYDQILLDHAAAMGAKVHQGAAVKSAAVSGNRIDSLELSDGTEITAKTYIDASGHSGILRRALGIDVEEPSALRNVAFWDYWTDGRWPHALGKAANRVQVLSIGFGWIWFIPIGPHRASVGLVCPADYYKSSGLKPEELYAKAIELEPRVAEFLKAAEQEHKFSATKDWSFVAQKMAGENWFLVGESAGFADPILAAGLTLTHASAREAAFTIIEIEHGGDEPWLLEEYEGRNRRRILQHIRFADYWYSANAHFSDLKEFTREIARDAGLELSAEKAFQWLGTGGFIDESTGSSGFGAYGIAGLHQVAKRLSATPPKPSFGGYNTFPLNLEGAKKVRLANYEEGRVRPIEALVRNEKILPLIGPMWWLAYGLNLSPRYSRFVPLIQEGLAKQGWQWQPRQLIELHECLETLVRDGWVTCQVHHGDPILSDEPVGDSVFFQPNREVL